MTKIAVTGATGRVGHHVVDVLQRRGHEVVPIARAEGVDVITGAGLDAAMTGVRCVVDAATGPSAEQGPATEFFTTAAANLRRAAAGAGVGRVVLVSIIGVDRFRGGYNAAKLAHEQTMLAGPVPVRVLRAAQFHEFVGQLLDWGTSGEVARLPAMRTQLIAARSVAEVIADLATDPGADAGPLVEVAGPRAEDLAAMAELLAARRGLSRRIETAYDPTDPDAVLMATGALLPGPDALLVGPTFERWLAELP